MLLFKAKRVSGVATLNKQQMLTLVRNSKRIEIFKLPFIRIDTFTAIVYRDQCHNIRVPNRFDNNIIFLTTSAITRIIGLLYNI